MTEHNDSGIEQIQLLDGCEDSYGGVRVEIKDDMDADVMKADVFASLLRASISSWKQQGKKGVWIKLPIKCSHLVDIIVKEDFRYHHAEPTYLMLVRWLPETSDTPDTIPMNASHRVGVGAFVLNDKKEVLVVQEHSGRFQGTGEWKLPTGVVNEGEDICHAVVREVKEETGVDTKFVEVLCFRQSHKSFFTKSDLFFLCVLRPESSAINKQDVEIEAAQWMPIEEYAAQHFVIDNKQKFFMAKICLAKADHGYPGFSARETTTGRGKKTYIYCNNPEIVENFASSK